MTPVLKDIVERAYTAFEARPPTDIGVCTSCCMAPKDAARLLNMPVRQIPERLMAEWMDAATTHEFPEDTWRHLLPRILEFLANGDDPTFVGREVILRRGKGVSMTPTQQGIVNAFQVALLADAAAHHHDRLDELQCMFALGGWPPSELGKQMLALPDDVLVAAMHYQFCSGFYSYIWTAFWDEPERSQMQAFYESRALYDRMEALGLQDGPQGDLAAEVVDAIFLSDE